MNISKFSVKRPITTLMVMLIAILLGGVSLTMLPVDFYPKMEIPVAIVTVNYNGVAPEEIENLITKPIEKSIGTVDALKNIISYSREGNAIVIAEFEYGTDMNFATLEMREKVDIIEQYLPNEASSPMVIKLNPNMMPIVELAISSDMNIASLHDLIDEEIISRLETIDGVASADIFGGLENEIKIEIDQEKLSGYQLSLSQISSVLQRENINLPSGDVNKGTKKLLVRTIGEFKSINDIKNIPITLYNGEKIKLQDIASIEHGFKDPTAISRVNGLSSIGITITKQSVSNTVATAKDVMAEISKIEKDYPQLNIYVGIDQSEFIQKSINGVVRNAVLGSSLSILVLFAFLRNIKSTLIIAIAIPVSIISTFALMFFGKLTINMISLGGLALGVGMLLDNSIVVLENIYRLNETCENRVDASILGANEVGNAIFASTLTTVAVFLPMVFVKGFTAVLFRDLSFTVTFALLASLLVSLTVVPMLSSKFLSVSCTNTTEQKHKYRSRFLHAFADFFEIIAEKYANLLTHILHHKKIIVIITIILFVASIKLVGLVGGELFPKSDEGSFTITTETPYGTSLNEKDVISQNLEAYLSTIPEIESYTVSIGNTSVFSMSSSNSSKITVELIDKELRLLSTEEISDQVRLRFSKIPGIKISIAEASQSSGGMSSNPIEVKIKGDDIYILKTIGEDIKEIIQAIPGTREVSLDTEDGAPEARIILNREKSSFYGITASDLSNSLETALSGKNVTTLKMNGDEIDINISLNDNLKDSIANMSQVLIQTPSGQFVAVSQIADIEYGNSPSQITRINQIRTVTVGSQVIGRDLQSITTEIESKLSTYNLPSGYTYEFGGQQKDMADSFSSLGLALLLSIIIIYMILASQFESLLQPFIIMLSLPFALTGAFFALFITQTSLSIPAYIGLIMLSGIVVNNAIVLVDFINQQRLKGMERNKSIILAGKTRLRPILMTTLTTILALMPIAMGLGDGGETQAPMGIVVIGGLSFSTLITLIFIPVMYALLDSFIKKIKPVKKNDL